MVSYDKKTHLNLRDGHEQRKRTHVVHCTLYTLQKGYHRSKKKDKMNERESAVMMRMMTITTTTTMMMMMLIKNETKGVG